MQRCYKWATSHYLEFNTVLKPQICCIGETECVLKQWHTGRNEMELKFQGSYSRTWTLKQEGAKMWMCSQASFQKRNLIYERSQNLVDFRLHSYLSTSLHWGQLFPTNCMSVLQQLFLNDLSTWCTEELYPNSFATAFFLP